MPITPLNYMEKKITWELIASTHTQFAVSLAIDDS